MDAGFGKHRHGNYLSRVTPQHLGQIFQPGSALVYPGLKGSFFSFQFSSALSRRLWFGLLAPLQTSGQRIGRWNIRFQDFQFLLVWLACHRGGIGGLFCIKLREKTVRDSQAVCRQSGFQLRLFVGFLRIQTVLQGKFGKQQRQRIQFSLQAGQQQEERVVFSLDARL